MRLHGGFLLLRLTLLLALLAPGAAGAAVRPARAATSQLPQEGRSRPEFSDVSERTPAEVVAYLTGGLPEYPGSGPDSVLDFSPSDILETMDTVVLEQVRRARGEAALEEVHAIIARAVLTTLREGYSEPWLLVPLDAGHGGKRGFYWDPGSEGTEAYHTRGVVAAMIAAVEAPEYAGIILRPIYNDAIADDFGLPRSLDKPVMNPLLMRQARASMLATEAAAWNAAHPDAADRVAVHELSIHFNAGSGGALVLHQGETVRPEFSARSVDYAERYLARVIADLNESGLLPAPLRRWAATGLHDDILMYRPDYLSDAEIRGLVLRYNGLQGGGYLPRYIVTVLSVWAGR
jgi:hypothetical protein